MSAAFSFNRIVAIGLWVVGGGTALFLIAPILAIIPLSFNAEPFFTYPMPGLSLRWYNEFFSSEVWKLALRNSIIVAVFATLLSTVLGTLAAIGLSQSDCPARATLTAILISPMIVPVVVAAVGIYYAFAAVGLLNSLTGLVLAHTVLGAPFVVVTVTAALSGFDQNLMRAAASLGAGPVEAVLRVMLPLIAPGVASGALFAFVTSFDEVVVALFIAGSEERTLPRQMWSGVRETLSPTIAAVAALLIVFSTLFLATIQWLQGRAELQKTHREE
ncbi:putative spermidine/putrescine transport system permease protein [Sinorhizobium kostiense]|uniref:Spermidine/putrescine transport system permease protein n=1 Tax=Sinorhizobium kostiense TaxID=76747 RepID=A0ABS4QUP1_9HYPH|nr:ABC transporter permease [Sinorhizobium kostiense]MBP2234366.1 putative spermidine/putrescine transport system permease protein [Sinorhizobium kostiense]